MRQSELDASEREQIARCQRGAAQAFTDYERATTASERDAAWERMARFDTLMARARMRLAQSPLA